MNLSQLSAIFATLGLSKDRYRQKFYEKKRGSSERTGPTFNIRDMGMRLQGMGITVAESIA